MNRREALKSILAAPAVVVATAAVAEPLPKTTAIAKVEPKTVPDNLFFQPYYMSKMVGWKGYWYRESEGKSREIVAFEDFDGVRHATPWSLQTPRYKMNK